MADSRIGDNVESPLVQPVVESSTTDVDASKKTATTSSVVSVSGAELGDSLRKTIENKNDDASAPVTSENQSESTLSKNDGGEKGAESGDDLSPTSKNAPSPKDGAQSTESEHELPRSGSVSPTKVDRKTATKKHSFKPVSVTKQFLKETTPTTTSSTSTLSTSLKPQVTSGSPGLLAATPRPTTISKLKLVRSGGSLQTSKTNGSGTGSTASKTESQPVWNKNKAPPPPAQPAQMTDEELTRKFGIHLASRLGPEETSKEAKWADIDDDDDDWVPETLEWDHKMKVATPADSKAPPSPISPQPESATLKDASHPVAAASSTPISGTRPVLKAKTTLVTNKEGAKTPEPVNAAPTTKSPWAKIPTPPIVPIPPAAKPGHVDARRDELPNRDAPPLRDISAEGYDRTWRDRVGGQTNRELFNSQTGQMEPAPESRLRNMRPPRHEAPMAKPAVLQRPSGSGHQPPEPSPAFQTHRTRPDDFRRRTNSNMSGGSGGFRRPSFSRQSIDDEYGPTSVFDDDAPLPPRGSRGHRGSNSPGFPPPSFGHHDGSPRFRPAFPHRDMASQVPLVPPEPAPFHEPSAPVEPVPSPADILEMQKRVMKESVEKARQRRLEEEARLEAEKRKRLEAKLAELERKEKERQEKEAAAKAAENAEQERITAEAKAVEEKRLAEEREAAEKKRDEAEKKRKETEAAERVQQAPPSRAEVATQWRRAEQPKFTAPSPHQPQPPPVWSSDRVRSVFNEEARPSSSTSTTLPPSFPRNSQQPFNTDAHVSRPVSAPDTTFINDASHPPFLPSSEASSTPSPHPITGSQARQPQGIYQHPTAPLRGTYPQFTDQIHTIPSTHIGPGNMASGFAPNAHPAQSQQQWPRQHGSQYGAIGDRTNRDQNDRGHGNGMYQTFGRGQSSAIPPSSGMPQNYGRGNMYQGNQRFVGDSQFNNAGGPHQFNGNDNRAGYNGFAVPAASHQPGYRNQQGIPPPSTMNDQSVDPHDPFYPGPPRQGRRPPNMAGDRSSPTLNNANPYRGQGRRSPLMGPGGQSPNLHNANLYQSYGRGRRSPNIQAGGISPNLNHAQIYQGNRQGRAPNVNSYQDVDASNNSGASPKPPRAIANISEGPSSTSGHENAASLQNDSDLPSKERAVEVSASDHPQHLMIPVDAKPAGVSAWSNYNAQEDDAQRAAQAVEGGAQDPKNIPATKQTIVFRHRQEKQTETQADAEVASWATRRGKPAVAIPEHFKPGYMPPARDAVASSLPPHLKAKTRPQELEYAPPIVPPQSPPPPISDDHPVHGDQLPRVHLPGQHDRRVATSAPMSQSDRISSVQDKLLSVMSQHRPTTIESRGEVTVALPPSGDDKSLCSMPGAEEFQEGLNHQPFGSTPTIRLPRNVRYPELVASDKPLVSPKAPKPDTARPVDLRYQYPFVVVIHLPGIGKKEIPWRPKRPEGSGRGGRWGKKRGDVGGKSDGSNRGGRGRGRQRGGRDEAKAAAA